MVTMKELQELKFVPIMHGPLESISRIILVYKDTKEFRIYHGPELEPPCSEDEYWAFRKGYED